MANSRVYNKEYYERTKERFAEGRRKASREHYRNNPLVYKERNLKRWYDITLEQYNQMFEEQDGCCAICSTHQSQLKKALAVDHCHDTGRIRKLLCSTCNANLGIYELNKDKFEKYLEEVRRGQVQ